MASISSRAAVLTLFNLPLELIAVVACPHVRFLGSK